MTCIIFHQCAWPSLVVWILESASLYDISLMKKQIKRETHPLKSAKYRGPEWTSPWASLESSWTSSAFSVPGSTASLHFCSVLLPPWFLFPALLPSVSSTLPAVTRWLRASVLSGGLPPHSRHTSVFVPQLLMAGHLRGVQFSTAVNLITAFGMDSYAVISHLVVFRKRAVLGPGWFTMVSQSSQ